MKRELEVINMEHIRQGRLVMPNLIPSEFAWAPYARTHKGLYISIGNVDWIEIDDFIGNDMERLRLTEGRYGYGEGLDGVHFIGTNGTDFRSKKMIGAEIYRFASDLTGTKTLVTMIGEGNQR